MAPNYRQINWPTSRRWDSGLSRPIRSQAIPVLRPLSVILRWPISVQSPAPAQTLHGWIGAWMRYGSSWYEKAQEPPVLCARGHLAPMPEPHFVLRRASDMGIGRNMQPVSEPGLQTTGTSLATYCRRSLRQGRLVTRPYTPFELGRLLGEIGSRVESAETAQELARLHDEIIDVLIHMSETESHLSRGRYDA